MSEYLELFSRRLLLKQCISCGQNKAVFDIIERSSRAYVGRITLNLKAENQGLVGEVDVNVDRSFDGVGYGIEAMKRLSEYAYEDLGLVKLYAEAPRMNLAAEYSLRRVGFFASSKRSKGEDMQTFEATSPFFVS